MTQQSVVKLSICIATFNRAVFIANTLDSIIPQLTNDCEIVVTDNASTDNTEAVVLEYSRRCKHLRYIRQDTNKGLDRNYDSAVEHARGEYCWLMTDDDLVKPGAVARVLRELDRDLSLVIANIDVMDYKLSKTLQPNLLRLTSDRLYGREEMDRQFVELDETTAFIGNVIIKQALWLGRERERFYGSMFIHVGMIYQEHLPGQALVIAEPLVGYRMGNTHTYAPMINEVFYDKWPSLVKSLAVSESARRQVRSAEPWRSLQWLLLLRGRGYYSLTEYRQWIRPRLGSKLERLTPVIIAMLPGVLINTLFVCYYTIRQDRGNWLQTMRQSRFYLWNWRSRKRGE